MLFYTPLGANELLYINFISTGCMKHWKALTLWKNLNYLRKIAGSRTVPIEIGSKYTEEDWTEQLVNFSEFLLKYIVNSSSQVGYLAQHQFFEQVFCSLVKILYN